MLIPVILSGGSGTRLWPLSRKLFPKQLMPLFGGRKSLLQTTVARVAAIAEAGPPLVVTNEAYRFMVAHQLAAMGRVQATIMLEPEGRNTAPAVAVAALFAQGRDPEAELLILPADHFVGDTARFAATVADGRRLSRDGAIVTFGVRPDKPETGYGYIKREPVPLADCPTAHPVSAFIEKPDFATAIGYVESGDYYWNSGIFLARAATLLDELDRFAPDIMAACRQAMDAATTDLGFLRLDAASFAGCPSDSIDYAVMEKTDKAVVVPLDCGWSDVGSWAALHDVREKDAADNVLIGDVVATGSRHCYFHSTTRLVAAMDVENLALVETKDAILVAPLDKVQHVKELVARLKEDDRQEVEAHCKVYRPWGHYEGIDSGNRYNVKRIVVYPGQTLSLQKHHHRAEHWVIVKGTAIVTKGTEEIMLSEDQSIYIPLGSLHRLHNPGKVDLELIEIQTGSYLGEDDIVRYDDVYGR